MDNLYGDAPLDMLLTQHNNITHFQGIRLVIYWGNKWQKVFNVKECTHAVNQQCHTPQTNYMYVQ